MTEVDIEPMTDRQAGPWIVFSKTNSAKMV